MQGSRRDSLGLAHPGRVFASITAIVLVIDQITKALVRGHFVQGETIIVLPHLLYLTYVHNVGAAFGLFPGRQPVFIVTSLVVLTVIATYWLRARPREWPVVIALALVTAGAVGNLVDRAFIGQVTDFFEFGFIDFPVFNVADMGIVGGVGLLAAWILFSPGPSAEEGLPSDDVRAQAPPPLDSAAPDAPTSASSDTTTTGQTPIAESARCDRAPIDPTEELL